MSPPPPCPVPRLPGTTSPCPAAPRDQGTAEAVELPPWLRSRHPLVHGATATCPIPGSNLKLIPTSGGSSGTRLPREPGSTSAARRPDPPPPSWPSEARPGCAALIPGLGWGQGLQHAAWGGRWGWGCRVAPARHGSTTTGSAAVPWGGRWGGGGVVTLSPSPTPSPSPCGAAGSAWR